MASKKRNPAEELKAVSEALKCEKQCENLLKDIEDKIATLEDSKRAIQRDLDAAKKVLKANASLTEMTRGLIHDLLAAAEGRPTIKAFNPKYVTTADKQRMLERIIADHQKSHPEATSVSYRHIRNRLVHDYQIANATTASFFRNELKNYETIGGNKNKEIVIKK
ncbi:MAG: hypothetical protein ACR2NF_03885 [Pirellulales bacterium]